MTLASRPIYLALEPDPVFGWFHPAEPAPDSRSAILIVPPWGWHEVASYRSRRAWAERLAADGHPTLRIDLPGTGDSGGTASGPDRVAAWIRSIHTAVAWLRDETDSATVAVIGMGLGALLAARAIAAGAAIDELVGWAIPSTGREEVRRQRAFARLQPDRYSLTEREPAMLPDGWLEVNGFVLSAATIRDLEPLRFPDASIGDCRRVLLLETDGIAVPEAIVRDIAAFGALVDVRPGPGWQSMTFHPQHDEPPLAVFDTVAGWLAGATAERAVVPKRPLPRTDAADAPASTVLAIDGVRIRESAILIGETGRQRFAILAELEAPPPTPIAAVFLNAGAVRRIGPNRIWVDAARRWAQHGVPSLRIDLEGIGDSDGDAARYEDVGHFYAREELAAQIRAFSDDLLRRTGAGSLILAGLCAGGYWAFNAAAGDERVVAAYLLNPGALEWRTSLVRTRNARRLRRLADPAWWRRLIRGQVRADRIRTIARAAGGELLARVPSRSPRGGATASPAASPAGGGLAESTGRRGLLAPEAILDRLRERRASVLLAFSSDEALHEELERAGLIGRIAEWPNVRLDRLPGRDHTLRPIVAQQAVHDLLDRAMADELARARVGSDTGAA